MGKIAKTFVVISVIWLLIIYVLTSGPFGLNIQEFIIVGVIPLIIGWGIYWIRRK